MFESWKLKKEIKPDEVDWVNVLKLSENGANPNIGYPSKVLKKAILEKKEDVVEFLLKKYPDLGKQNQRGDLHADEADALETAIKKHMVPVVQITKKLLQTDIALDIENQQGYTAYDIALESGHPAFAELIKNESLRRQGITQVSSQPTSAQIVQQKNLQQIRER